MYFQVTLNTRGKVSVENLFLTVILLRFVLDTC